MRLYLLLLCFSAFATLNAQSYRSRIHFEVQLGDTTQSHQLILLDYSKFIGLAREMSGDSLYFRLHGAAEDSAFPTDEIRYLGVFSQDRDRRVYGRRSPGFTDMTYERTALPFQSGAQYRNISMLYHVVEWNLNKTLQVGTGIAGPLGVLLTQRIRTAVTPNLHLGISNQFLWPPIIQAFTDEFTYVGDLTGVITFGNQDRFFNLGAGMFYASDATDPTVFLARSGIGGRIGEKWHLYAEAVVSQADRFNVTELYPAFSAAYGSRRHRWQFGVFSILQTFDNFVPPPVPFLGYALYW